MPDYWYIALKNDPPEGVMGWIRARRMVEIRLRFIIYKLSKGMM